MNDKEKQLPMKLRVPMYSAGVLILAFGISLNKKAGLGVSPIVSISNAFAKITGGDFGNWTFVIYSLFVMVVLVTDVIVSRRDGWEKGRLKKTHFRHSLQIIFSIVFTRILNVFEIVIPEFAEDFPGQFWGGYIGRTIVLVAAVIITGIGVALTLDGDIVPNPGEGMVQAMTELTGKGSGLMKNCLDAGCILFTAIISLAATGELIGIGYGTIIAVIGVGRVVAVYNHFIKIGKRKNA